MPAPITNYCLPYQRGVPHTSGETGIDEPMTDIHVIFSNSLRRTSGSVRNLEIVG
jgi:hypothetical protein